MKAPEPMRITIDGVSCEITFREYEWYEDMERYMSWVEVLVDTIHGDWIYAIQFSKMFIESRHFLDFLKSEAVATFEYQNPDLLWA